MGERITSSEVGTIRHRAETWLSEPRRCSRGHLAPHYANGTCSACNKEHIYRHLAARGRKPKSQYLQKWTDYQDARRHHEETGGWLVRLDVGLFGTTQNPQTVERLRGRTWLVRCEQKQCWDEVAIYAEVNEPGQENRANA